MKKIHKAYFYLLSATWYIFYLSFSFFPYAWDMIFSEEQSFAIYNNLLDLLTVILAIIFLKNVKDNLEKKKYIGIIISILLLIYPSFLIYLRISDNMRTYCTDPNCDEQVHAYKLENILR